MVTRPEGGLGCCPAICPAREARVPALWHYDVTSSTSESLTPQVTTSTFRGTTGIIVAVAMVSPKSGVYRNESPGTGSLDLLTRMYDSPTFLS